MSDAQISMDDIARVVGVSRTTVSFVINRRTGMNISDATVDRVWAAARELGYRPNAGAQALASRKTNLLGLITDITASPFGGGIIHGAQSEAWDHNKLLLIVSSEGNPQIEAVGLEMLLERRVEGVIFATQSHREIELPKSVDELPTVLVHCFDAEHRFPSIVPDEFDGGSTATRRLLDAGHTRVGFINLDPGLPASIGRLAGYEAALVASGVAVDPELVENGHATATGGYMAASALLDLAVPPTAIFCATDRMAMGAYDAIKERGMTIPEQIAVVGYDNQDIIASYLRPPLTTVALPFEEMGSAAVRTLATWDSTHSSQVIRGPLIERQSV